MQQIPTLGLSIKQLAEGIGLHPSTIRKEIQKGNIRAIHISERRLLVPMSEVERLLSGGSGAA